MLAIRRMLAICGLLAGLFRCGFFRGFGLIFFGLTCVSTARPYGQRKGQQENSKHPEIALVFFDYKHGFKFFSEAAKLNLFLQESKLEEALF